MRLFNTQTQEIEPVRPRSETLTLYVCGITPYDTTHLGHAFINVIYDTLVRFAQWRGQPVTYVQNVTDIDDDILRKSRELNMTWDELGARETARYQRDLRALNVAEPTHYVRASSETAGMISLIQTLMANGHAYEREGWVYFRVRSDPHFGRLAEAAGYVGYDAWLTTANERGNFPDDTRKEDPLDFVLWQAQQPGEPAWPSPWGPGRPGWHIECSSMAVTYLGSQIDIHGGGSDLIFPHHTCEIAQSENATGKQPFVQTWMHCAMVGLGGEKMSKSLGNLILVRNLLEEYTPDEIRVMLLSHHYRTPWEYTRADMQAGVNLAQRLIAGATGAEVAGDASAPTSAAQARADFIAALDDDLDTPRALRALALLATSASAATAPEDAEAMRATLRELGGILGLTLAPTRA